MDGHQYLKLMWILIKFLKTKIGMKKGVLTWTSVLCVHLQPLISCMIFEQISEFIKHLFFSRIKTGVILSFLQVSEEGNPKMLMENPLKL